MRQFFTGLLVIWSIGMAVAIFAAFLGIGSDCVGLSGSELNDCQASAWARGGIGLLLLGFLWLIFAAPLFLARYLTRPREPA